MNYKIPVFKPDLPPSHKVSDAYAEICKTGVVSNFGQFAQKFENIAKEYLDNENAFAVGSCDTGLVLSIAALDLPKGSNVLVPSFTFTSTINAIVWNGLNPVFVDIDPKTFNVDVRDLDIKVGLFAPKLIMATHIFGNPCDMFSLEDIKDTHNIPIIFDAAHGYGSKHLGDLLGWEAENETSVFSFSGTKLVTSGEGGLIATNKKIGDKIRYLRGYGFLGDYNAKFAGLNGKISEFNAAIGCLTLPTIEDAIKKRNEIVQEYKRLLQGLNLEYQHVEKYNKSSYKDFAVLFDCEITRNRVYEHLDKNGIQTKKYFMPLHKTDRYKSDIYLPNTENVASRILCLPIYNSIKQSEIGEVCQRIKEVL